MLYHFLKIKENVFFVANSIFSHDEACDQTEAAQDGFNGSQHVCYLIISSNKCNSLTCESTGIYIVWTQLMIPLNHVFSIWL